MSDEATVIEAECEEIGGTELEVRQGSNVALFGTSDPVEVVEKATKVADSLADVIRAKQLFSNIQGRSHVKVEGWQLLGSMLGVTAICTHTEALDNGFRATVEARATDGRVVGRADALCTRDEKQWAKRDDYALLSMAQTRATSKALKGPLGFVVSLAGYETTPSEEMPSEQAAQPEPAPPEAITPENLQQRVKASGLTFGQVNRWLGANVEGDLPDIESDADALTAFHSLTSVERNRLAAAALAYKTEREQQAARREQSLQHDAEVEAA